MTQTDPTSNPTNPTNAAPAPTNPAPAAPTQPTAPTQPSAAAPAPTASQPSVTGTVVPGNAELSSGATAGIGVGIGVGNICCSPFCYGCPTLLSSMVGLILYFSWKQDKPKTAHSILVVTLVTGGIGLLIFAAIFFLGLAGAVLDGLNY